MAWETLKATTTSIITSNAAEEITGALLRGLHNSNIYDVIGAAKFQGIATPATAPGTQQSDVFYIAFEAGTYTNFSGINIAAPEGFSILQYNDAGSNWVRHHVSMNVQTLDDINVNNGGVIDGSSNTLRLDGTAGVSILVGGGALIAFTAGSIQILTATSMFGNLTVTGAVSFSNSDIRMPNLPTNSLGLASGRLWRDPLDLNRIKIIP